MSSPMLAWLDGASPARGVYLWSSDAWKFVAYASLAEAVCDAAHQLAEHEIEGRCVCIVASDAIDFVKCFYGVLLAGGTPCPIAPPLVFSDAAAYRAQLEHLVRVADPAVVVVDAALRDVVAPQRARCVPVPAFEGRSWTKRPAQRPTDLALVQFTSGSSGAPRAVRVTHANLSFMIDLIRKWLRMTPDDGTATWLPLYHDMGLIGTLLTPIANGSDLRIMAPYDFIQDPTRWLRCLGSLGAVLTSAPNFGYGFSARRATAGDVAGMDFSRVRACIIGAERVDPAALEAFHALLAPRGFRRQAFLPAYGLAEATLAVTGLALDEVPTAAKLDWRALRPGAEVGIVASGPLGVVDVGDGAGWLVGAGRAHEGVGVAISHEGSLVGERVLGEIVVDGALVAAGYAASSESSPFVAGKVITGDAGFVHQGQLYVVGRMGDSVKIRGRHVYVEDLEAQIAPLEGIKRRCVLIPSLDVESEGFVLGIESGLGDWLDSALAIIRRATHEGARIRVVGLGEGGIPRTTSGKPRRRVLWNDMVAGRMHHDVLFDTHAGRGGRGGAQ